MSITPEFPEEILDENAAAGTPKAAQAEGNLDDVWCLRHGAQWSYFDGYWRCMSPAVHDPDDIAQITSAISCQPVVNWDPAKHPDMVETYRLMQAKLRAEGIDPDTPRI